MSRYFGKHLLEQAQFRPLSPIHYKELKTALYLAMKETGEFSSGELGLFITMLDRIGKDDISQFLFIMSKFKDVEVSEKHWAQAKEEVGYSEKQKKIALEKYR